MTVHHGDCLEVMANLEADSIDAIVTDPPYGLGFRGKAWDALPPGEEWARECLRVLKPGGHMLAFGGSRTWHRLAVAIEDAGFEIRDSIAWLYASGMPKSKNVLKPAFEPIVMGRKKPPPGTKTLNIESCRVGDGVGRWPANVALDSTTAELVDAQSGNVKGAHPQQRATVKTTGRHATWDFGERRDGHFYNDEGGASRFFYVAKASKKERPIVDGVAHPTVKPLSLMRWLCRLVTPEGGTVLDPFAGSGTTLEAAALEGFRAIGIEAEADYLPLIQARLDRIA